MIFDNNFINRQYNIKCFLRIWIYVIIRREIELILIIVKKLGK